MGKIGQPTIRLVSRLGPAGRPGDTLILCPFLDGLDPADAMWLGPLAWHDCNAALLDALAHPVPPGTVVFAGVFCAEPFRSADSILARLAAAGVLGVANLPSVSFLDGQVASTLDALNLGTERELGFLGQARTRGFRIACCARDTRAAELAARLRPELMIHHAGPGRAAAPGCPGIPLTDLLGECAAVPVSQAAP